MAMDSTLRSTPIDSESGRASHATHCRWQAATRFRVAPAFVALLLVVASTASTAQDPVRKPVPPTGEELLRYNHESLRPSYQACMDSAAGSLGAQEECIDEEFAYQDGELNRIYREKLATLSGRDQNALREIELRWIRQIYGDDGCKMPADPTPAQRLDTKQCLTAATIIRWRQLKDPRFVAKRIHDWLNPRKSDDTGEREIPTFGDFGLPDSDGKLELQVGDISIRTQVENCKGQTKLYCQVKTLAITAPWGEQVLAPPQLFFLDAADQIRGFDVTAYRGDMSGGFGSMLPTFIIYDLNSDGDEDLMLWTDPYGSYGDPSYTYFLFDPARKAFVEIPALTEATRGFTLSRIRLNQLDLWYRSGPCLRGEKVVAIRGTIPVEISHNDYSTCD